MSTFLVNTSSVMPTAIARDVTAPNTPEDAARLSPMLRAIEATAAHTTQRYLRAFEAGNPIPPPRSDAAHRAVRRYDTSDPEPKTLFHSKRPAPLPVAAVFENLAKRVPTFDAATGLVAAVLMLRFQRASGLRVREPGEARADVDAATGLVAAVLMLRFQRASGLPLTTAMLHRLYLACLVVAAKAHHDAALTNDRLARHAGVSTSELNRLEAELLRALDFRCLVTAEQVEAAVLLLTEPDSPWHTPLDVMACSSSSRNASMASSDGPAPEFALPEAARSVHATSSDSSDARFLLSAWPRPDDAARYERISRSNSLPFSRAHPHTRRGTNGQVAREAFANAPR
eukprot:CAMPEP_0174878048 /NCGR_PEP_ID=MMETSP1114-20130205/82562_1 /TAXON_ID=312471 /ORGANISM="Neobodo designis, Strain CCAP 1951/1" /LENGTH=342 /DNA_ID=CAMNT_0016113435 /DNA_START=416 /DNA_END=1446 /DNA_ORIENTATION=+